MSRLERKQKGDGGWAESKQKTKNKNESEGRRDDWMICLGRALSCVCTCGTKQEQSFSTASDATTSAPPLRSDALAVIQRAMTPSPPPHPPVVHFLQPLPSMPAHPVPI